MLFFLADSHYLILHNGSLVLSSISGADEGVYRCVAGNKAGKHFKEIKVTVNGSDDSESTPTSPSPDDNLTEEDSSQRTRDCIEYKDISFGPNPVSPTLPPPSAQLSNSVNHTHTAQSPYFTAVPPSCVQSLIGYRIVLNCSAGGSPQQLNITWEKDEEMLQLPWLNV